MTFKIGFLPVSLWDILDILIVGFLIYQLYKLLRGSVAFNIFVGIVILYVVWMLVDALGMDLLKLLLGQFVSVGVLMLLIVFQPEVRRFLLFLGNSTLRQRSNFFERIFTKSYKEEDERHREKLIIHIKTAMLRMSKKKIGALIVISGDANLEGIINGGIRMDAQISSSLLESIFTKGSPLHDGAVIIANRQIIFASAILPVSKNLELPKWVGLRHRAAVGITEKAQVTAFIVSEENGRMSYAQHGKLMTRLSEDQLSDLLRRSLK